MDDKRSEWKECELCDNSDFQPGAVCAIPEQNAATNGGAEIDPDAEEVVRAVTDQILKQLNS